MRAAGEIAFAVVCLARTTWLFRVRGDRAVARAAARLMRCEAATPAELDESTADIWRSVRALKRAGKIWPGNVRCLQFSMALHHMLRRNGVAAALRIGVPGESLEQLSAHAWVQVGDYEIDDQGIRHRFVAFEPRVPAPAGIPWPTEGPAS